MREDSRPVVPDETLRRVRGEYLEMPGLCLRPEQARRLWGLDADTCARVLDSLVQAGFLCRAADGTFRRPSDVRPALPLATAGISPRSRPGAKTSSAA
jgi:hypothetical protein